MRAWWWGFIAAGVTAALLFSRRASASDDLPPFKVVTMNGKPAPRGIRNNNPGNLRDTGIPWQGVDSPRADDVGYLRFTTPVYGIRAMVRDILDDHVRDGLRTVRALITEYAPPSENDTAAYIAAVSKALGVTPDDTLDLRGNAAQLEALVRAVIKHENGVQPYTTATIREGLERAVRSFTP